MKFTIVLLLFVFFIRIVPIQAQTFKPICGLESAGSSLQTINGTFSSIKWAPYGLINLSKNYYLGSKFSITKFTSTFTNGSKFPLIIQFTILDRYYLRHKFIKKYSAEKFICPFIEKGLTISNYSITKHMNLNTTNKIEQIHGSLLFGNNLCIYKKLYLTNGIGLEYYNSKFIRKGMIIAIEYKF